MAGLSLGDKITPLRDFVSRLSTWIVPHRFYLASERRKAVRAEQERQAKLRPVRELCGPNVRFRDRHRGERCFILGNGPSANKFDLRRLAGETVFTVSNGYLRPHVDVIRPRYHCVPQIDTPRLSPEDISRWFEEMHERLGNAEIFLSLTQEPLVRERGLFRGRPVGYVALQESLDVVKAREILDISGPVPRVESVPIMCLMIALYMGFSDIYLLGVDHDHFRTGEYHYAFDITVIKNKDYSVASDGKVLTSHHDDFQSLARLWRQYRVLREIAETNGIRVFNATEGGELDEFPRVSFQDALRGAPKKSANLDA